MKIQQSQFNGVTIAEGEALAEWQDDYKMVFQPVTEVEDYGDLGPVTEMEDWGYVNG